VPVKYATCEFPATDGDPGTLTLRPAAHQRWSLPAGVAAGQNAGGGREPELVYQLRL